MNSTLLATLSKYGISAIIAVYLVMQLATKLPSIESEVQDVGENVRNVQEQHRVIDGRFQEWNVEQRMSNDSMVKLMRSLCLNQAEGRDEVQRCNP